MLLIVIGNKKQKNIHYICINIFFTEFFIQKTKSFGHAQVKFNRHSSIPALGWMDGNSLEEEGEGALDTRPMQCSAMPAKVFMTSSICDSRDNLPKTRRYF